MIAQAYYYDKEKIIRIFKDDVFIADLPLEEATEESADRSLRTIGLRRRTKWIDMEWGKQAKIRFNQRSRRREDETITSK